MADDYELVLKDGNGVVDSSNVLVLDPKCKADCSYITPSWSSLGYKSCGSDRTGYMIRCNMVNNRTRVNNNAVVVRNTMYRFIPCGNHYNHASFNVHGSIIPSKETGSECCSGGCAPGNNSIYHTVDGYKESPFGYVINGALPGKQGNSGSSRTYSGSMAPLCNVDCHSETNTCSSVGGDIGVTKVCDTCADISSGDITTAGHSGSGHYFKTCHWDYYFGTFVGLVPPGSGYPVFRTVGPCSATLTYTVSSEGGNCNDSNAQHQFEFQWKEKNGWNIDADVDSVGNPSDFRWTITNADPERPELASDTWRLTVYSNFNHAGDGFSLKINVSKQ